MHDLIKILNYNAKQEIHFYRMTSKLIPLATHQEVLWDYSKVIQEECQEVADLIKKYDMRVDAHPDQFNVLNSINEAVIEASIQSLYISCIYLSYLILSLLNLFYMWGKAGGKEAALERFIQTFHRLPPNIQKALIIENDDKVYSADDVLKLCQTLNIPMVLDIHHHRCYNEGIELQPF